MRRLSLNARLAQDAEASDEIEVALFKIEHPDLEMPIRISTDNTERLSDDPLMYGTRSTWLTQNPAESPFLFLLVSTILPSDLDDAAAGGNIVLENVSADIGKLLRSVATKPTIHMAVVLASQPNVVEAEWLNFLIDSHDISAGEVRIDFSREDIEEEKYPGDRMIKNRYPGMHR